MTILPERHGTGIIRIKLIMTEFHLKLLHQEDMHGSHLRQQMERHLQLT